VQATAPKEDPDAQPNQDDRRWRSGHRGAGGGQRRRDCVGDWRQPGAPAKTTSATGKAGAAKSAEEQPGHAAITAAVARTLHLGLARVSAALAPVYAAGRADTSSPVFVAAARSLGISTQQLASALASAKQSLANAQ
jgi:hypothetical protein